MTAIAAKYSKSKRRHTFGGTSSIQTPLKELLGDKKSVKKRKQQRMEALEVQHKVKYFEMIDTMPLLMSTKQQTVPKRRSSLPTVHSVDTTDRQLLREYGDYQQDLEKVGVDPVPLHEFATTLRCITAKSMHDHYFEA